MLLKTVIALALVCSATASSFGPSPTKPGKSVRVGNYLVTATRVVVFQTPSHVFPKLHRVVVEVTVKNASQRIPRTELFPRLKVKPDYEYYWYGNVKKPRVEAPNLVQLLPGEESAGGYVFDVRNGATPVALIFEPMWNGLAQQVTLPLAGVNLVDQPGEY